MYRHPILILFLLFTISNLDAQEKKGNSALLVIDMQEEFTHHAMDSVRAAELIENINSIITAVRPLEVIFIKANAMVLSISFKGIKAVPAEHTELDTRLLKNPEDIIFLKKESSAFSLPELTDYLDSRGIENLLLTGIYLGQCISGTAIDGTEKGYVITVIEEGVTAKSKRKSQKYLNELEKSGVKVISLEEFLRSIG